MRTQAHNRFQKYYRTLVSVTLVTSGLFQLATPVFAIGTAANTQINNTATGTYEDPDTGQKFNATSNTVTITVAEVAGVTATRAGIIDRNAGSVTTNDFVDYNFLITNQGNDATAFHIPTTATIVGGTLDTAANATGAGIAVAEINGVVLTNPVALPANGNTNDAGFINAVKANGYAAFDGSIAAGSSIKVIVPVKVTETIAGNNISVRLGNTGANDNSAGTQNQPDSGTEPPAAAGSDPISQADEIYTINVGTNSPVNGVREASALDQIPLATQINSLALATVFKTRINYSTGPSASLADDTLTYRLDLRVESSSPAAGITPAPLQPTKINLDSGTADKILVSDALPANTKLDTTFTPPALPSGWTMVYSEQPTSVGPLDATQAWKTGTPTAATTRIGFIHNGPLAPGSTTVNELNGLQVRVITSGIPATGGTVVNIAQAFGQTTAGTGQPIVYDESGDQNPNNYEGSTPGAAFNPTADKGIANISQGSDANNNNTGAGVGGEVNLYTINPPGSILNGPSGQPGAIGPDGTDQTDFVNKSTNVPANTAPGGTYDPDPLTFTNTVANPNSNTNQLDNVILEPISANKAATATGKTLADYQLSTNGAALMTGTKVTIAYPVSPAPGTVRTATYTLTGGEFVLSSSTTGGVADGTATAIKIPSIAIGSSLNYGVTVDLPANSIVTTAYSVPIVAYVDSNPATQGFKLTATEDNPFNIKIDRVYTGYLKLDKQSRILKGTGPDPSTADAALDSNNKTPAPGNIIEYQVQYTNISTPSVGTGNAILNANKIEITEDGAAGTNNWATTTTNVPSTASDTNTSIGATITYFVNTNATTTTDPNVTKYIDTIPTLPPSGTGTFIFQRQVKDK